MTPTSESGTKQSNDAPEATLISVILDCSGSMGSVHEPTIKGFNSFLLEQRQAKDGGRALMSLTQFDDQYEVNFIGEPIENVPDLDTASYVPRGSTALNDAIGRTIHELEAWTAARAWKERVLVLIITDGQENASREYSLAAIRALIERKENDGWNFVYMGANQDSFREGEDRNVRASYSTNWDATAGGADAVYAKMSRAAVGYRAQKLKGKAAPAFFDDPADAPPPAPREGKLKPKGGK